jgi:mannitol/fructose-specific phosphotransferase system IIA component (Ntr-type)
MKSLLNALQEGRLVELPVHEKEKVLEYLAILIEAIPDIGNNQDIVAAVNKRESASNTGIGMGVACPHVRAARDDGELFCAVGWSQTGIDYGSPDGRKVHLVIMYYIPNSQRSAYLKEVSGLAKAIKNTDAYQFLASIPDLQTLRSKLLDWMELATDKAIPDFKARMIKLEDKQLAVSAAESAKMTKFAVAPFSVLITGPAKCTVLTNDIELMEKLEGANDFVSMFNGGRDFEYAGHHISVISETVFPKDRLFYQCVAVK